MTEMRPFLVNGEWRTGEGTFEVHSPYDGSVVAEIAVPTAADVEEAVSGRPRHVRGVEEPADLGARRRARSHLQAAVGDDRGEREPDRGRGWQATEVGDGRGHPRGLDVPVGLRGDPTRRRRSDAPGHRAGAGLAARAAPSLPARSGARHHALQLPAEPGRAQGGALARGRSADRGEAGERDADRLAASRRVLRRDRPAQGHVPGAAGQLQGRRRHGTGRPVQEDLVHRIVRDRLVPQGPGPEEARDARARRQRRRDRPQRRRPGPRRSAHRVRRLLPGRTELHQRAARARGLRGLRRLRGTPHQAGRVAEGRRPDGPDGRRRSGDPGAGG